MKKTKLRILSLLLVAVLLLTGIQMPVSAAESGADTETAEEQADTTTFPTIDGDRQGMWSSDKELTIVIFGGTKCVYSPETLKVFAAMGFPSEQVEICHVDMDCTTKSDAKKFIEENELPDDITYCYEEGVLDGAYYVRSAWHTLLGYTKKYMNSTDLGTPSYVITDKNGVVQQFQRGALLSTVEIIAIMDSIGYGYLVPDELRPDCIDVECEVTYDQTSARQMLNNINEFRTGEDAWYWDYYNTSKVTPNDLEELTYDYALEKVAMQRAAELVAYYDSNHARPNGFSYTSAYGKEFSVALKGENIAMGPETNLNFQDEDVVFTAWREENAYYSGQGHRRNMLSSNYKSIGIAHVEYKGYHYWVQEFSNTVADDTETEANNDLTTVNLSIAKNTISDVTLSGEASKKIKVGDIKPAPQIVGLRTEKTSTGAPDLELLKPITAEWKYTGTLTNGWLTQDSIVEIADDGSLRAIKAGTAILSVSFGKAEKSISLVIEEAELTPSAKPDSSISPEPSSTPGTSAEPDLSPTPTPSIQPTASVTNTPKPSATTNPTTTKKPSATTKPTVTKKPTSTKKPTATKKPTSAAVGQTITDAGSKATFVVTGTGSVGRMPEVAFKKTTDTKKKTVVIPSQIVMNGVNYQVTSIAAKAFKGNKKITKVTIPNTVKKIGASAFQNCSALKTLTIGKDVTMIDANAFKNCKKLTKLTIKSSIISVVGKNAFKGIPKKAKIKVPKTRRNIYKTRFAQAGLAKSVKLKS